MTVTTESRPRVLRAPSFTPPRPSSLARALFALALGGFAIGTAEFVSIGLLPEIADGVGISIPAGGHLISAYALGVVVGAPCSPALGGPLPPPDGALGFMVACARGNVLSAIAPCYGC